VSLPTCSIITPTWQRRDLLLTRCIPSVQKQGYPAVEHIVISDGPDPALKKTLAQPWQHGWRNLWYDELPVQDEMRHWGGPARLAGLERATGEYIGYCDDDDALRPEHCGMLAAALDEHPEAGFAVSQMYQNSPSGGQVIGNGELAAGNVGTPMIVHRRSVLDVATWGPPDSFEDWKLVWAWLQAGIPYVRVPQVTADAWPSGYW
jgi:glycosyltransferase involved in cell wall biosynthesis